jgi:hypothetical protein
MSARHRSVAFVAALFAAGCATVPSPCPPAPARDESAASAFDRLRARATSFRTVRGVLELVWRTEDGSATEGCRASISCAPPDSLWIRGTSAAFFTVFDLSADARRVRLDIPREGVAIFGRRDDPAWDALPLSASELLVALLADPCPGLGGDSLRWDPAAPSRLLGAGWRLDLHDETGLPAVWSRSDHSGREIRWDEWTVRGGVAWPLRIDLLDSERSERLEVRMGRLDFDRAIPAGRFSLDVDPEREVITPSEAKSRWERRGVRLLAPDP